MCWASTSKGTHPCSKTAAADCASRSATRCKLPRIVFVLSASLQLQIAASRVCHELQLLAVHVQALPVDPWLLLVGHASTGGTYPCLPAPCAGAACWHAFRGPLLNQRYEQCRGLT
jgi:hypothetical protein